MIDDVPVRAVAQCPLVAHTPRVDDPAQGWHTLREHLITVGDLAGKFGSAFDGESICRFVGLIHDAGKATADVQAAFRQCLRTGAARLGTPHKLEGAALAYLLVEAGNPLAGRVACLAAYGHHNQIPAWDPSSGWPLSVVFDAMRKDPGRLNELIGLLDGELGLSLRDVAANVRLPARVSTGRATDVELFARMCHSALCDADYLDTARHFAGAQAPREHARRGMIRLRDAFVASYAARFGDASDTRINAVRAELYEKCRTIGAASPLPHGVYRLPAQTGSGKTMAAAAFALEHAVSTSKRRVIVAVPYTSITTQNAAAYRDRFDELGRDVVLEHHSNIVEAGGPSAASGSDDNDEDAVREVAWRKLSAENWDAEFIVTTTVQLFDSLLDNRPSRTRRLHRIADSVIVLDEVQSIPLELVPTVLGILRELVEGYGVTVLLASATQPAFWALDMWKDLEVTDIADPADVPEPTQRARFLINSPQSWDSVAADIASHDRALAIVNTTRDAQSLHAMIEDSTDTPTLHLSTRMCGQHRLDVLAEVGRAISAGEHLILVSTQIIEAGVDLDFPVVFRAFAPAESLIQSAGRCNREGRLGARGGTVHVVSPIDGGLPPGSYATATTKTRYLMEDFPELGGFGEEFDLSNPEFLTEYYLDLYHSLLPGGDSARSQRIQESRGKHDFPQTAHEFSMIDSDTIGVVVDAYGDTAELLRLLDAADEHPELLRSPTNRRLVNRFTVQVRPHHTIGQIVERRSGVQQWVGDYHPARGVTFDAASEASIW
ncbi:CRISPR-associated endonuclease/helicase Cas3 [Naumannella cuiyingiana]|uniref:CRISPR-associated endonuclease/helicase Cas3 n=1 Tax=Naumannella cuiyingiana TaxID=1347891 RepID=A0A7Z0D784_9ACTN|nr:CRISPR-associated endonuclease/helicase Cas3 [Naumannella cuiyingiana]